MNKFKNLKVGDVLESGNYKLTVLEVNDYEIVKPEWRADVEGQEFWYIADNGDKEKSVWTNHAFDKFRLKSKNCFETEELAEEHYKKVMES